MGSRNNGKLWTRAPETHKVFPSIVFFLRFFLRTTIGIQTTPFSSAQAIWYFVAAVSVLAAAVGLFGMGSALAANRSIVKAFEAFYVLSLLTQFALLVWALIWCKQNQTQFDTVCTASQAGQIDSKFIPGFVSDWSCQKIYTVGIIVLGVGGAVWLTFNVSNQANIRATFTDGFKNVVWTAR